MRKGLVGVGGGRWSAGLVVVAALGAGSAWGDTLVGPPNDPWYGPVTLSGGGTWPGQTYLDTMHAQEAWGISTGSTGVIVAIVDSGVAAGNPDFVDPTTGLTRVLPALSAVPDSLNPGSYLPPLDGSYPSSAVTEQQMWPGHGTWCASAVAMTINNGRGGAGVGNFSILPITATSYTGVSEADWLATGIRMAADNGAKVISISQAVSSLDLLPYEPLEEAAAYARSKGALTFVAAGNSPVDISPPAGVGGGKNGASYPYPDLIFVAGTTAGDQAWADSAYGSIISLSAPAENIFVEAAVKNTDGSYSYIPSESSGTLYAAPFAAGAAALAWSINPNLTADEVLAILEESAAHLGVDDSVDNPDPNAPLGVPWNETFGYGRVDLGAVAEMAAAIPEPASAGLLLMGAAGLLWRRGRR